MKHYVVYHNPEKVGYTAGKVETFNIMTSKSTKCALDNRIWLITSEGTPKNYYLVSTFIVDNVGYDLELSYRNTASGSDGKTFRPMIRIDDKPWFKEFMKSQANFSLGFNLIKEKYSDLLEKVAFGK